MIYLFYAFKLGVFKWLKEHIKVKLVDSDHRSRMQLQWLELKWGNRRLIFFFKEKKLKLQHNDTYVFNIL